LRLGIFSDTHLGFSANSKRSGDALFNARQALELLAREECDCILMAGDFFNEEIPSQEAWHDAFELLAVANSAKKSIVKISVQGREKTSEFSFEGVPVIAIHGTHEHRPKGSRNALEVLQRAGALLHLHASKAIVEKGSERVCVFGLGGVPEKYAKDALKAWAPKAVEGCFNALMLHQSFTEFLPFDDEMTATLSLEDLPKGFDLVINGHLHWSLEKKLGNSIFLLPGSTLTTQLKSSECQKPKGVFVFDTLSRSLSFSEIPEQRCSFYAKLKFDNAKPSAVLQKAEEAIAGFLESNSSALEPLIRVKCVGSLEKGFSQSDVSFAEIEKKFSAKALLSLDRSFDDNDFRKTIAELRELQAEKKSVSKLGLEILQKKLLETSFGNAFDVEKVFELLDEGKTEEVERLLKASLKN